MTHAERARRYLQASMNAGYTGLPDEHREAYEEQMRAHERKYANVAEHALVGADRDFDEKLRPGEREHQRHLQREAKLSVGDLEERRKKIRDEEKPTRPHPPKARKRTAVRVGARAGRTYYRAHRSATRSLSAPTAAAGSVALEAIGFGLGLVILYLILSPNGSKAFQTLLSGLAKALRLLVEPVDPLVGAIAGGKSASSGENTTPAPKLTRAATAPAFKLQSQNQSFGPGVGVPGNALQPAGGGL